jgi:hypothetical protein
LSDVRERSRSAREHSENLRHTSKQLRDTLENLRVYAGLNGAGSPSPSGFPGGVEHPPRTPLEVAVLMRERAYKICRKAELLRRCASDLRQQAAAYRARSENLRSNSASLD